MTDAHKQRTSAKDACDAMNDMLIGFLLSIARRYLIKNAEAGTANET